MKVQISLLWPDWTGLFSRDATLSEPHSCPESWPRGRTKLTGTLLITGGPRLPSSKRNSEHHYARGGTEP